MRNLIEHEECSGDRGNVLQYIVDNRQNDNAPENLCSRAPSPVIQRLLRVDLEADVFRVLGSRGGKMAERV